MRLTILAFLFTLVLRFHSEEINDGGHCPIKEQPYLVAIVKSMNFKFVCAGTLLSKYFVLTAASCLNSIRCTQRSYEVLAGANVVKPESKLNPYAQISEVANCFLYSKSKDTESYIEHNIAIIKLKTAILENFEVKYVKLATTELVEKTSLEKSCNKGTVMGWTKPKSENSTLKIMSHDGTSFLVLLQCYYMPVLYFEECKNYNVFNETYTNVFCAHKNASTVCHGDAGGPFMCNGVQFGILSNGSGCNSKLPAVYIKVYQYANFIQKYASINYEKSFGNSLKIYIYLHFMLFMVHLNDIIGF